MKKLILTLLIGMTVMTCFSQNTPSYWEDQPNHKLELNYNMLGRNYAQGLLYGSGGYALGMWLSGNRTGWGLVGSVVASNLPILIDGRHKQPEVLIGRSLGALTVGVGFTATINLHRKGKQTYQIKPFLRKHW